MSNLTFMNANKSKESRNFVLNYIKGIQIPAKLFQFRNSGATSVVLPPSTGETIQLLTPLSLVFARGPVDVVRRDYHRL